MSKILTILVICAIASSTVLAQDWGAGGGGKVGGEFGFDVRAGGGFGGQGRADGGTQARAGFGFSADAGMGANANAGTGGGFGGQG